MYNLIPLKTPVYIFDNGSGGALEMFLTAIGGVALFVVGWLLDEFDVPVLGAIGDGFLKKIGIGLFLTGVISGIVTLL